MGKNTFGYIPVTEKEQEEMLKEIGVSSMDELFAHIPDEVKLSGELQIPSGMTDRRHRRKEPGISGVLSGCGCVQAFYTVDCKECDIEREFSDGLYALSGRDQSGDPADDL